MVSQQCECAGGGGWSQRASSPAPVRSAPLPLHTGAGAPATGGSNGTATLAQTLLCCATALRDTHNTQPPRSRCTPPSTTALLVVDTASSSRLPSPALACHSAPSPSGPANCRRSPRSLLVSAPPSTASSRAAPTPPPPGTALVVSIHKSCPRTRPPGSVAPSPCRGSSPRVRFPRHRCDSSTMPPPTPHCPES